jgi:hypothetical protein
VTATGSSKSGRSLGKSPWQPKQHITAHHTKNCRKNGDPSALGTTQRLDGNAARLTRDAYFVLIQRAISSFKPLND